MGILTELNDTLKDPGWFLITLKIFSEVFIPGKVLLTALTGEKIATLFGVYIPVEFTSK